ncbi:hypothetical protein EYF80_044233 [Liparis tanakae]|uniref:Uncharacterized protein n=1 Tax=Liparis tanakae TaxID=230148 RepID=A0A4Z2FWE0_9TELE|nr:hypothetical protein EYF80_044233 [Liparis tanakae]
MTTQHFPCIENTSYLVNEALLNTTRIRPTAFIDMPIMIDVLEAELQASRTEVQLESTGDLSFPSGHVSNGLDPAPNHLWGL